MRTRVGQIDLRLRVGGQLAEVTGVLQQVVGGNSDIGGDAASFGRGGIRLAAGRGQAFTQLDQAGSDASSGWAETSASKPALASVMPLATEPVEPAIEAARLST